MSTSGCSGVAQLITTIPTSVSSLTLAPPISFSISNGIIPDLVLSLSGTANGAPQWVGQFTFGTSTADVSLIWSNTTINGNAATWALVASETALIGAAPFLYNTGGNSNALPISGWTFTTSIPFTYDLVTPRPTIISQPACQTTISACENTPFRIPITVSNATSFRWFKGSTALTGQTSATLNLASLQESDEGVYSLSATGPYGSITSNSIILTVNAPPANFSVTSGKLTCTQQIVNLSAVAGGGTNYTLTGGSGGPRTSATGQFTANQAGSYTVAVTNSNGCTATAITTVSQSLTLPAFSVGSSSACAGALTSLSANGCAGGTIRWPDGSTGSTFSTSVSGPVTATCTIGICSTTASGNVTINQPTPSLQASSYEFCAGSSITLTAGGGSTYAFMGPGLTQSGNHTTAIVSQGGVFSVVVTSANTCTAATAVSLTQLPTPNALLVGNGNLSCTSPTLSLTAVGGRNYLFSGPGIVSQTNGQERIMINGYLITRTPIPTIGMALVNKPGPYQVVVTGENGCTATATIVVTGTACLGGQ